MKTALYHNPDGIPPRKLVVVANNDDGTVNLGVDEKNVLITRCRVSATPVAGQCTLDAPPAKEPTNPDPAKAPKNPDPAKEPQK